MIAMALTIRTDASIGDVVLSDCILRLYPVSKVGDPEPLRVDVSSTIPNGEATGLRHVISPC
jgi:hypothetical protein